MRRSQPPARERRTDFSGTTIASVAIVLARLLAGSSDALADLKLPPRPRDDPPMRIVRITSSDPACAPHCPEWISAEGRIMPATAGAFRRAILDLGGRRLPVLISSRGGSLGAALQMGELIRERRLAVAVARTLIVGCPKRTPVCPPPTGQAITGGAVCASACPLILAGGVERLVGPVAMVGVHQITEVLKEKEGLAQLTTVKKIYEPNFADSVVQAYLASMGVGDPVMTLLRKTPASSIRWLSLPEMADSHLATESLDAVSPIQTAGANGLNGHGLEGAAVRADLITAKGEAPTGGPVGSPNLAAEATLIYRRGGGAVEFAVAVGGASAKGWTLIGARDERLPIDSEGAAPARAAIPRERFCALAHDGKLVALPEESASASSPQAPVTIEFAAMEGLGALLDEACP